MPSFSISGNFLGNFNMSGSSSSISSSNFSSISSTNGQVSGQHISQSTQTDRHGNTTINRSHQRLGEAAQQETRTYDKKGRQVLTGEVEEAPEKRIETISAQASGGPTIEDVTDDQATRDKQYEEAMEDEYAKREGGA